ncbi:MAG: glycerophosphodiester phosphodiesterase, partial [Aeromicrobium sp.]|nr:glycerophosphodiester phosphodiesterase [Aeromicrobium sp.]
ELKNPTLYPGYENQVADVLKQEGFISAHRVIVHSFGAAALRQFHAAAPDVPIGLITHAGVGNVADETWLNTVNPTSGSLTAKGVSKAQAAGLKVFAWPGPGQDTVGEIRRDIRLGVDGVITNRPHLARIEVSGTVVGPA